MKRCRNCQVFKQADMLVTCEAEKAEAAWTAYHDLEKAVQDFFDVPELYYDSLLWFVQNSKLIKAEVPFDDRGHKVEVEWVGDSDGR